MKYGGLKFLEAAHVKDVLSILRWADNPRNRIAGFRAVRIVRGIGAVTATRLLDAMDAAPDPMSIMDAFPVPAAAGDWRALVGVIRALRTSGARSSVTAWPADIDRVIRWYEPELQRIYEDAAARQADLVQLAQIAATYPSRERFLTEMTLDPPSATSDEAGAPSRDDDYLILSTIHSAKGQEWKSVHILNVVDGCIPSDMATGTSEDIEEERRLLYVAMTRAKEHLHLIVPQRFFVRQQTAYGDRHVHALRSRFIPAALEPLFDERAWPVADRARDAVAGRRSTQRQRSISRRARGRAGSRRSTSRDRQRGERAKPFQRSPQRCGIDVVRPREVSDAHVPEARAFKIRDDAFVIGPRGHRVLVSRRQENGGPLEGGIHVAEQPHSFGDRVLVDAGLVDPNDGAAAARKGRRQPAGHLGPA